MEYLWKNILHKYITHNAERITRNAERITRNAERGTHNAERKTNQLNHIYEIFYHCR